MSVNDHNAKARDGVAKTIGNGLAPGVQANLDPPQACDKFPPI
jgi:hypothetical protein